MSEHVSKHDVAAKEPIRRSLQEAYERHIQQGGQVYQAPPGQLAWDDLTGEERRQKFKEFKV